MAAILQRQPLTIKQKVEELKNWHKQQQSKMETQSVNKSNHSNKNNPLKKGEQINNESCDMAASKTNFDEIPIKVTNSNLIAFVENNVPPVDTNVAVEPLRPEYKGDKPKFRFLKKGEGIARFNMGPRRVAKKTNVRKQGHTLKLVKDPIKSNTPLVERESVNEPSSINSGEIPTLNVPDVKLNVTWKSLLRGESKEDMLEKAISSNQLELLDPNSSINSSTASLMEKILAIGKNKLARDREELKVYEVIEQHVLDSSFCSTSSYVTKLMANAVMSTPDKDTCQPQKLQTPASNYKDQLPSKSMQDRGQVNSLPEVMSQATYNPFSYSTTIEDGDKTTKISEKSQYQNVNEGNNEPKAPLPVVSWNKPENIRIQNDSTSTEETIKDLEQSLHVRFADQIDYKSFVENSQSCDSSSQREEKVGTEFDESQEWKDDGEDSSSCCSEYSRNYSSTEDISSYNPQENPRRTNLCHSQSKTISTEQLHVGDLKLNDNTENDGPFSNDNITNFSPLLIEKLKELESEIKVFREENYSIRSLRENLERERKQVKEEMRQLNLEKRKLQKQLEEEQKRFTIQLEEEKQKLAKEKIIFEKYSKSLTKKPSREERKEILALQEQLAEMKEELNKKESRWGAAQARVRNQVKVLEEDNRKLKEEIENFRKQAKYWELFNQKKKGKPFNNTKLIHAISEHISNIVLDNESSQENNSGNAGYFNQTSSATKIGNMTQSDIKSMYGVKVIKENKNSNLPSNNTVPKSISNEKDLKKAASDTHEENVIEGNHSPSKSDPPKTLATFPASPDATITNKNLQNVDRCQKPCPEDESSNFIRETVDENGNVEIVFPNGNIKRINKITGSEKYIYVNGDVEEITHDGTVKYYYSKSRIWQTTLPDGLEIVDFPDGKVEKRHVGGTVEIIYSNNNKKFNYPDGSQEILYTNGTRLKIEANKTQILTLPNGQKEVHTEEWKRREYPDGTKKTLFPDGTTETVYANGRVRLKDKFGNLVMDSGTPNILL